MERVSQNHKRRGSIKTKPATFLSRAVKPDPLFTAAPDGSRVKPASHPDRLLTKHSLELSQWSFAPALRGPLVGSLPDPAGHGQKGSRYHYYYGYDVGNGDVDEDVNTRAAHYIEKVLERFKQQGFDTD